jgi:hypothetical protein
MGDTVFWEDNNYLNLKKFVKSYLNLMKKDMVLQAKDEEEFISHIEYLTDVNSRII